MPKEFQFKVPIKLKHPLYAMKRKTQKSIGKLMIEALTAWHQRHGNIPASGTEAFDDAKDRPAQDVETATVSISFPKSLRDKLLVSADERKMLNPRVWPNSINAIGIQALEEFLPKT